jgi:hypothetical protein
MKSQHRVTLLNDNIPAVFWGIKVALCNDVVLTICRLTDEKRTGGLLPKNGAI